ncbi:hypothetical protein A3Q56_04075 [Intoshia linei]|uniref:Uncharacterized protein n=1 Tax=Intoshia linei TaxID=1819745 RepID=A0A177B226_9BILA|nr:hypothetical protein A3Q56_04075 [Intoshia linei]
MKWKRMMEKKLASLFQPMVYINNHFEDEVKLLSKLRYERLLPKKTLYPIRSNIITNRLKEYDKDVYDCGRSLTVESSLLFPLFVSNSAVERTRKIHNSKKKTDNNNVENENTNVKDDAKVVDNEQVINKKEIEMERKPSDYAGARNLKTLNKTTSELKLIPQLEEIDRRLLNRRTKIFQTPENIKRIDKKVRTDQNKLSIESSLIKNIQKFNNNILKD